MNIRTIPPYLTNTVQNSSTTGKAGAQDNTTVVNGVSSDQVKLSQDYQDLAQAQKSIAGTDEVRTDKVQQIKSRLESGSYQINPGAIAGKMLDEII
jgi:negative regulator of flagellin synthesis FlgM